MHMIIINMERNIINVKNAAIKKTQWINFDTTRMQSTSGILLPYNKD
jgi:hypothetical protein